ncbi:hypothetical protein [Oricola sp.]|uniref:hypothetical protein n=1 Tax=Oricola sp. TaxID=1979950 RepID=UPI003BAB8D3B
MKKIATYAAVAGCLAALGGCVIDAPGSGGRFGTYSGAAEGNWADSSGVATSRFNNGSFVTFANDTGNRLAEGTYRYNDARNIEINMRSLVRQTRIRTNCLIIGSRQMNCTSDSGAQFTLTRS